MLKEATIRARTEPSLKTKVEEIFETLGLNATTAINLFYKNVLLNNGLPFDVKLPNKTTQSAIKKARANLKQGKHFKNTEAMFRELKR